MKRIFILLACTLCCTILYAQNENNVWPMGYKAGLDFNSGAPVAIETGILTNECSAMVCDTAGHLLFYTSGDTIWNRNHVVMPNGGIPVAASCVQNTQGAVIAPVIGSPGKYYVFSMQSLYNYFYFSDLAAGRLYYSIVDMSLDGGLGDVEPGNKAIQLDSALDMKMITVPGDSCNIWLILHDNQSNNFKTYNITAAGISATPLISSVGTLTSYLAYGDGQMKISPNRRKLAIASTIALSPSGVGVELYNFNHLNGAVSGVMLIDTLSMYGLEFSPDNTKLYTTCQDPLLLLQYNITLGTDTAIMASKDTIATLSNISSFITPLKLGPDGMIYCMTGDLVFANPFTAFAGADSVGRISNPNLPGAACNLQRGVAGFVSGTGSSYCFPNVYNTVIRNTITTTTDSTIASADSMVVTLPAGITAWYWNDGTTTTPHVMDTAGTYWVKYSDACNDYTDTFVVSVTYLGVTNVNGDKSYINIFPNPAQDHITIKLGAATSAGTLQIMDAAGRVLSTSRMTQNMYDISTMQLANGIYQLTYTFDDNTMRALHTQFVIVR